MTMFQPNTPTYAAQQPHYYGLTGGLANALGGAMTEAAGQGLGVLRRDVLGYYTPEERLRQSQAASYDEETALKKKEAFDNYAAQNNITDPHELFRLGLASGIVKPGDPIDHPMLHVDTHRRMAGGIEQLGLDTARNPNGQAQGYLTQGATTPNTPTVPDLFPIQAGGQSSWNAARPGGSQGGTAPPSQPGTPAPSSQPQGGGAPPQGTPSTPQTQADQRAVQDHMLEQQQNRAFQNGSGAAAQEYRDAQSRSGMAALNNPTPQMQQSNQLLLARASAIYANTDKLLKGPYSPEAHQQLINSYALTDDLLKQQMKAGYEAAGLVPNAGLGLKESIHQDAYKKVMDPNYLDKQYTPAARAKLEAYSQDYLQDVAKHQYSPFEEALLARNAPPDIMTGLALQTVNDNHKLVQAQVNHTNAEAYRAQMAGDFDKMSRDFRLQGMGLDNELNQIRNKWADPMMQADIRAKNMAIAKTSSDIGLQQSAADMNRLAMTEKLQEMKLAPWIKMAESRFSTQTKACIQEEQMHTFTAERYQKDLEAFKATAAYQSDLAAGKGPAMEQAKALEGKVELERTMALTASQKAASVGDAVYSDLKSKYEAANGQSQGHTDFHRSLLYQGGHRNIDGGGAAWTEPSFYGAYNSLLYHTTQKGDVVDNLPTTGNEAIDAKMRQAMVRMAYTDAVNDKTAMGQGELWRTKWGRDGAVIYNPGEPSKSLFVPPANMAAGQMNPAEAQAQRAYQLYYGAYQYYQAHKMDPSVPY